MMDLLTKFYYHESQVLFFAYGTMWQNFDFSINNELESVQRFVKLHPNIRKIARESSINDVGKLYNSLHIRFMDGDGTALREGLLKPNKNFIFRMRKFQAISNILYVATIPSKRTSAYFSAFKKAGYILKFSDSIKVDKYLYTLPKALREGVLGLIEQLICSRGKLFLGTGFSTFSELIRRKRRHRILTYDSTILKLNSTNINNELFEITAIDSKTFSIRPGVYSNKKWN